MNDLIVSLSRLIAIHCFRSSRPGRDVDLRTKQKESKSSQGYRGKRRKEEEEDDGEGFDPMDPSSYSDAPKGYFQKFIERKV